MASRLEWVLGTAGESFEGQQGCGSRLAGQAVPGAGVSVSGGAQAGVDLAGDVTLEAADDLCLRQPLGGAPLGVGGGGGCELIRVMTIRHSVVGLAVAAGVEAVAGALARGCGDRAAAHRWAQAASERSRPGWSPAAMSSSAAVPGPIP